MKGYTSFSMGFLGPEAVGGWRGEQRTFDYDRGRELIKSIIKDDPECVISLGLREDWNNTSGFIYDNGTIQNDYFYLSSCWATPIINVWREGQEDDEEIECWKRGEGESNPSKEWIELLRKEVES